MKILILGGDGMLGHQLLVSLQKRHDVRVTLHQGFATYQRYSLFQPGNSYFGIDVRQDKDLLAVITDFQPEAIINGVGIVKQRESAKEAIPSLEINALFPHRLDAICAGLNIRLVQISTDCVFSGRKGNYVEGDISDADDLYGRSKYLGELSTSHSITLRTSIIGLELSRKTSLIEWFLAQKNEIKGYRRAIYSGLTTFEMSRVIEKILLDHSDLSGVWHVAGASINKYDLLIKLTHYLNRENLKIIADDAFICDRSLNGVAFERVTGYRAPSWDVMLQELAEHIQYRETQTKRRNLSIA